ncbi:hypothetical protein ACOZ4N_11340 [Halorientalis pallida]|uniref:hypothetical protein n=1 Tax=Halorientalis pallida TaxID=2479928 RepID=UPI003C6EBCC3
MTDFHNLNTPQEGSTDWHQPLNENFRLLDEAIEVRDVESNRSNYQPKQGAKFFSTDSGRIYLGDGQEWQVIGTVASGDGSVSGSGLLRANSPDDINTQLQNLPNYGGIVRLEPDFYNDDDWTKPIVLPNKEGAATTYTIDMRGSRITLSDFSPDRPYIDRTVSDFQPLRLQLFGPTRWDVKNVTNPPSAVRLYDISMSDVWLPALIGPFEWAVEKRAEQASGHFNRIRVQGWDVKSGFKIGDQSDSQTSDRSFYVGQFSKVTDYGAKIEKGKLNTLYAQVESTDGEGFGYGYHIKADAGTDTDGNRLKIQERGADIPFHIMAPRTQIDLVGGLSADAWARSNHVVSPSNVSDSKFGSENFDWSLDRRSEFKIGGSVGATTILDYGALRLKAGSSNGGNTYIETVANATKEGGKFSRVWGIFYPSSQNSAVHRYGIWEDRNNHVLAEADMTSGGEWRLVARVGGSTVVNQGTGVQATDGYPVRLSLCDDGEHQSLSVLRSGNLGTGIARGQASTSSLGFTDMRAETTVSGSPGGDRTFDIVELGYEWI